jgi:DNA-binding transcriptional LysR family regulator
VSQPALSRSISILERSLGVELLKRTRNGADLTKLGSHLVSYAQSLDALLMRAAEDIRKNKIGLQGSIIIGVSPVACADLVPEAVVRLKAIWPGIAITIEQGPDDALLDKLRSSTVDLVVSTVGPGSETADIAREILLPDSLVVVTRAGSPWAGLKTAGLRNFDSAHWVMPNPNTVMWQNIQSLFAAENTSWPDDCTISNSILAIKSLIARSDFVTVSSRELMKPEIDSGVFVAIELQASSFVRQICVRSRQDAAASPVIGRMIALLREVAHEMQEAQRLGRLRRRGVRSRGRVKAAVKSKRAKG